MAIITQGSRDYLFKIHFRGRSKNRRGGTDSVEIVSSETALGVEPVLRLKLSEQ